MRRFRKVVSLILFFTLLLSGLVFVVMRAEAALRPPSVAGGGPEFLVNDPADPGDPNCTEMACSLRAAILAANAGVVTVTQTIAFDLNYPVTITLGSSLPAISGTVVISGPGLANLTVSGDGQYQVFHVAPGASLNLSGIAIRLGYDDLHGAGIYVDQGTLDLSDSLLADHLVGSGDGGGLHNAGGAVTITNTTFADNNAFHDGAIANHGAMTVSDSLFTGNQGRIGGAIENNGTLTVTNSTFTQNVAPIASGGAIQNGGTLVVANSTFFDNGSPVGADIYNGNGTVHVTHSTFYSATLPSLNSLANVGLSATMTVSNTLLAAGPLIENCSNMGGGLLVAGPANLSTDATCAGATVVALNQLRLGPLQDNVGRTPTIGLLPGSLAIDAAADPACTAPVGPPSYGAGGLDQRGVARPQGSACDVGALERLPPRIYLPLILKSP